MKVGLIQFVKFGIVGVLNNAVYLLVFYVAIYFRFHYQIANLLGFIISVLNAYYWSKRFVFNETKNLQLKNNTATTNTSIADYNEQKTSYKQIVRVYTSYGSTTLLSALILFLLVEQLKINTYVAPLITLVITVPLNFILNKFWVFK